MRCRSFSRQSTILALARPASLQAEAGVPSKVGEYLASGIPTVITRTGELGSYLQDGVSVFFARAGDCKDFSARLRHVLDHPAEGRLVGLEGRAVARRNFDYRAHMERLAEFIGQLA